MKTILVLGSAGQVGSHLSKYLSLKGYEVLEYDIENSPAQDLRQSQIREFQSLVYRSDFIYFLAFDVGGSQYLEKYQNTFDFIDNNMRILTNTIDVIRKFDKPFLFASSQMSNMGQSTYGLLKMIGERYTSSIKGRTVKFWNVYGHEKDERKFHVISDFIKMARENGVIKMKTNGMETRDFLYADDCCAGLEAIMLNFDQFQRDEELHLANFKWNTILEVAEVVADYFNAEIISGTALDNLQQGIKNEPNRKLLDYWKPVTSLHDGIKKIIQLEDSSLKTQL
jgi:nucleoside-diphosphate-sugar epimerase